MYFTLIKKYAVLIGIIISSVLLIIATVVYPGGTFFDQNTTGFNWTQNFLCNLFGEKALNAAMNPSRIWACSAMIFFPLTYGLFFFHMAEKICDKNASYILKYVGTANVITTFLIIYFHDLMLIISTTLFWTCMIVITAYIFKTKLYLFKIICVISLLGFYYSVYLWGTNDWRILAIMQKVNFLSSTVLILGLEYFTRREDFVNINSGISSK